MVFSQFKIFAGLLGAVSMAGALAAAEVDVRPEQEQIAQCLTKDMKTARVLVTVEDIMSDEGNLRLQVYSDNPDDFLEGGKKLVRIDVPAKKDSKQVCVTLPRAGDYALVVLHDRNGNGRANFFSEGFGFSNNPELNLAPPEHEEAVFSAANGVKKMQISLNYVLESSDDKKKRRRRR